MGELQLILETPFQYFWAVENIPAIAVTTYHIQNVPGCKSNLNDTFWIKKHLTQYFFRKQALGACDHKQRYLRDITHWCRLLQSIHPLKEGAFSLKYFYKLDIPLSDVLLHTIFSIWFLNFVHRLFRPFPMGFFHCAFFYSSNIFCLTNKMI